MDSVAETATVVIRPSLRAAIYPHVREDVYELLHELIGDGHEVTLQLPDPGQFSVQNSLETVGIYILGGVLSLMATDIYNGTKRWLVKRFSKNEKASAQVITIYVNGNPTLRILGRSADHIVDMTP
ncbi:MAG TPA: hypothetical protein VH084_26285 [Mycobacterium sp.]|jgi:hypothetical protein|nr:hypothetical protein [Mycobacterium sp.]